ncbi:MAG: bifunctional glutamate N-acetyltransferase/amino-acid acetyltransferase ArgJ [Rhodospirillales bacterium]
MPKTSPLAPARFPIVPPVAGVRLATHACQLRYRDRDDVLLVELAEGTAVAGVLTRSTTASAPVLWCRNALMGGAARALVVNAGNANAFTGALGEQAVGRTVEAVCAELRCPPSQVFVASTGVIGEPLRAEKIVAALAELRRNLTVDGWEAAARAIATTDTYPKGSTARATIDGVAVTISGIAKGSGMIAPDMATMLGFVFTDAAIAPGVLQVLLGAAVDRSFNCITVDGDTSTSDTLLLFATGAARHDVIVDASDRRLADFRARLGDVMVDLAHQVVRDGEGASKFVTIGVSGAESDTAARRIGLAIANSPLVKTAIAGADANWGRIVMAIGKSGEKTDRNRIAIRIGGLPVALHGAAISGYEEGPVAGHMKGSEIDIAVDVGVGDGSATVWTCDLTHDYISINADYRS